MDRRTFLTSAAALIATRVDAAPSTGMFLALNNALIGNKVQWPDSARLAARVGFGGIDLNLNAAMKEGLEPTRKLLEELKLRLSFCSLPVNVTGAEDVYQRGLAGSTKLQNSSPASA